MFLCGDHRESYVPPMGRTIVCVDAFPGSQHRGQESLFAHLGFLGSCILGCLDSSITLYLIFLHTRPPGWSTPRHPKRVSTAKVYPTLEKQPTHLTAPPRITPRRLSCHTHVTLRLHVGWGGGVNLTSAYVRPPQAACSPGRQ